MPAGRLWKIRHLKARGVSALTFQWVIILIEFIRRAPLARVPPLHLWIDAFNANNGFGIAGLQLFHGLNAEDQLNLR